MSNLLNRVFSKPAKQQPYVLPKTKSPYSYKKKFLLVGTVGAGKSSVVAALYLTAMTLSSQLPNFICNILENNSNILDDVSRLRRGHYPVKTEPSIEPITAGLVLTWKSWLGEKNIQIPTQDISGEAYFAAIKREKGVVDNSYIFQDENILGHLDDADGLIPVIAASRALMFRDDLRLEDVPRDLNDWTISEDDDVNLTRIINAFQVRKHQQHKDIEAVGLIIHKWDLIAPYAKKAGMDIYDPTGEGFRRFMENCYPTTSMALKRLMVQGKVKVFPSHIEALRNTDGTIVKWPDGKDRVATLMDEDPKCGRRMCKYSEQTYVEIFNWLKVFSG